MRKLRSHFIHPHQLKMEELIPNCSRRGPLTVLMEDLKGLPAELITQRSILGGAIRDAALDISHNDIDVRMVGDFTSEVQNSTPDFDEKFIKALEASGAWNIRRYEPNLQYYKNIQVWRRLPAQSPRGIEVRAYKAYWQGHPIDITVQNMEFTITDFVRGADAPINALIMDGDHNIWGDPNTFNHLMDRLYAPVMSRTNPQRIAKLKAHIPELNVCLPLAVRAVQAVGIYAPVIAEP